MNITSFNKSRFIIRLTGLLIFLYPATKSYCISEDTLFNGYFHKDVGGWIAGDGTFSVTLPDGKTLWLFGESIIGEVNPDNTVAPGSKRIRNSAILQDGETFTTITGGTATAPSDLIPTSSPDSTYYRPAHGLVENDTLFIFLEKYRKVSGGANDQNFVSNDVAMFAYPSLNFYGTITLPYYPVNKVIYGSRLMEDSNFIYIYGSKIENPVDNIPYPYIARAKTGNLTGTWEFYTGQGWDNNPETSQRIANFQVSREYAVFKHAGRYVLITQGIWYSTKIWSRTAASPQGPWTNTTLVYDTPLPWERMITYGAYPHLQFDKDNELLVSYNSNGDFLKILGNIDLFKPKFIRVPYSTLDASFISGISGSKVSDQGSTKIWPNPASSFTNLEYRMRVPGIVRILIFDARGRTVTSLSPGWQNTGSHQVQIVVGTLAAGIYFYHIEAGE